LLPWLLSYVNGSTAAGFAFANFYRQLPGTRGAIKGLIAGVLGWLVMNLVFFPLMDMGPFATQLGLGLWPAVFSLGMMLAYSIVMGTVYGMIHSASLGDADRSGTRHLLETGSALADGQAAAHIKRVTLYRSIRIR
jgi:hypothetical protein